ncbi:unnamed protein product [Lepeophtheirus salmonis]|uniref:(salmon louse) hypothetical protein n=1 Tax=Lepeophtheirus salmonis TaxID=72036 RepID=A0A7R8HCB4_LEPSM|nr:unnamed protein product [Lepeophtheirus salmonis]CAF3004763.1 unnamed protein product [Lepeophtheirus salmonis]
MTSQITNLVNACNISQAKAPSPPAKYLSFSPTYPWVRAHVYFLQFKGKDLHILVEAGSKWIEAIGFPKYLHSDNSPQFTNNKLKSKMSKWEMKASLSPSYYPESNVQAERVVQILKDMMKKNPRISSAVEHLFDHNIRIRIDGLLPNKSNPMKEPIRESTNVCYKNFNSYKPKWIPDASVEKIYLLLSRPFASIANLKPDI